jgi:putative inorganic carbon (HCO3(-)) transporter
MVFVVPLAISNLTFLGFRLPFTEDQFNLSKVFAQRLLGLVALAAWSWDLLRRGGWLRRTPIDWLILAFLGWVAMTTATSINWPAALFGTEGRYEGLLSFVNYAVIYFLILQFADTTARVRTLARALFFSSLVVAGYGVLQYAGWNPVFQSGETSFEVNRAFSTYGNPDMLGGFLIFSTTIALGLALAERSLTWRLVYWAGFGLSALALIVSFTRGAWIGAALSLLLLVVIAWRQGVGAYLRRLDWLPAGIAAVLGTGIIWRSLSSPSEVMNFGKRLGSILEFSSGSGKTRTEIWQAAWAAIKQRPVQGWGADSFRLVFPRFKPIEFVRDAGALRFADNAHNYPLHLAVGIGIPGMLMMYGIFAWAAVRSFATVFRRSDDPSRLLPGAFWAAAAGYLLHLFAGVSVTGVTFLLWVALGVVLAPTAKLVEVKAPRWGSAAAVVVVLLAALGIGYQGVLVAADRAYLEAQSTTGPIRTEAARKAVRLNPLNGRYRTELGLAYHEEAQGYLAAGLEARQAGQDVSGYSELVKQRFASAETAFRDAIAFDPHVYENYVYLADLYNFGGDAIDKQFFAEAVAIAADGIKLDPFGPAARVFRAQAYLGSGRTAEAIAELEYSLKIAPGEGNAALVLADAYEVVGRRDDALAVLRAVETLAPGQPGVADAIRRLEEGGTPAP